MNHQDSMCYVAIGKCGHVCAASVIDFLDTKEQAKTVADWIRRGCTIEQMTVSEVKEKWCKCKSDKQKKLL